MTTKSNEEEKFTYTYFYLIKPTKKYHIENTVSPKYTMIFWFNEDYLHISKDNSRGWICRGIR
jgi:hypothetical protein